MATKSAFIQLPDKSEEVVELRYWLSHTCNCPS